MWAAGYTGGCPPLEVGVKRGAGRWPACGRLGALGVRPPLEVGAKRGGGETWRGRNVEVGVKRGGGR